MANKPIPGNIELPTWKATLMKGRGVSYRVYDPHGSHSDILVFEPERPLVISDSLKQHLETSPSAFTLRSCAFRRKAATVSNPKRPLNPI